LNKRGRPRFKPYPELNSVEGKTTNVAVITNRAMPAPVIPAYVSAQHRADRFAHRARHDPAFCSFRNYSALIACWLL